MIYNGNNMKPKQKKIGRRTSEDSNVYLYKNEEEENNNLNYKNIENIDKSKSKSKKKYVKKQKNYFDDSLNENGGNNIKKINPLLERMRRSKMNNNTMNNTPFSRRVFRDNNQIKITYKCNDNNYNNILDEDEYGNNTVKNYHHETMGNNYIIENDFY